MIELYKKIEELKKYYNDFFNFDIVDSRKFIYNENIDNIDVRYNINIPYNECILIKNIEGDNKFNHLSFRKSSDIILISKNINGYKLDIIEMKSAITDNNINKLAYQLINGYLRIMTVLSPLHLDINKIDLYVSFYDDSSLTKNLSTLITPKQKRMKYDIDNWKQSQIY
ncbi:hypothetical protein A966_00880 [Brachyspira hampsonii 30446]|uniref:Uncharacterized protein n=1 Tax=Brachyspira hampsonii 30446 TaxID=1289135 RepID=A0A2U4FFD6_9SPIR|nr:hypothetical protein [Brachyspira hampsonii]EKV58294.1 hypothetical protein A966_00880 [Brachyspira hampsonii 30446]MBW5395522.1 hypothetical protein [Brachyspira hampsonii]OEJ16882.1 hypothetical protein A9495_08475 [Brachyspira hampsonii]